MSKLLINKRTIAIQVAALLPEIGLMCLWHMVTCHPQGLKPLVRVRHTKTNKKLINCVTQVC